MSPAPLSLTISPLTAAGFEPFGEVIETAGAKPLSINEGTTERFHDLAGVDVSENDGKTLINIFRGQPRPRPIEIKMVERHPLGSQAFVPLQDTPWLVVVAPVGDSVGIRDLRCFQATGKQGVNYRRGVWHHPLLVLQPDQDFLVVDRGGRGQNCDEIWFSGQIASLDA